MKRKIQLMSIALMAESLTNSSLYTYGRGDLPQPVLLTGYASAPIFFGKSQRKKHVNTTHISRKLKRKHRRSK